jgi:hypothetical protein
VSGTIQIGEALFETTGRALHHSQVVVTNRSVVLEAVVCGFQSKTLALANGGFERHEPCDGHRKVPA